MTLLMCFFLTFLSHQNTLAQNGFYWSNWVGCAEGVDNIRKDYAELIAEGLCHRACNQSTVTYTITGVTTSQMANTVWHVVGGTVLSTPNNSQCVVKWGATATGAIGFTTTNTLNNTSVTIPDLCVNLTVNPVANFTIAPIDPSVRPPNTYTACTNQELFFENLSTTNGGTAISSNYWDFGDGTTSSTQSPSHTYNQDGFYTVTLKVDNQCNCSSIITYTIEVRKKGVQIDCASIVCEGQKATYTLPLNFAQNCRQFNWSVIGGTIQADPPYNDSIEVLWDERPPTSGFGYVTFDPVACAVDCYKPTTLKIPIIKKTASIIGDSSICGPAQVRYKVPQWPTTDFQWEIVNSGATNATLTFTDQRNEILLNTGATAGTVVLKCVYTNTLLNCGGIATPLTITIKQPANISGTDITCLGTSETYTESGGTPLAWQLQKLPNGAITNFNGIDFTHTFASVGDYSLTASGPYTCNPISKLIKVTSNATPLATDFVSPLTVCPGSTTIYNFNNTVPNSIIRWQVTGGQILGTNSGNAVPIIFGLPPASGANYTIKLWRENISGPPCPSGILTLVPVIPVPDTVIKGATLTNGTYITSPVNTTPCGSSFATYQVGATDMDNYEWEILPPNAGNITVPDATKPWLITVLWNQFTNQAATLRLKTKKCLQPVVSNLNVVIASPTVILTPSAPTICRDEYITFSLSSNLTTFSDSILWDFGNGVTLATLVPTVTYQYTTVNGANLNYQVKATITNPNGCTSVVTTAPVSVQVKVTPVALITPAVGFSAVSLAALLATPIATRTLTATVSAGYGATQLPIKWYNSAGIISPQPTVSTSYVVTDFGEYYALVTNVTGCSTITNKVSFFQFIPDTTPACPVSFNPILSLSNPCGTLVATVTNAGNPTSTSWRCDLVSYADVSSNSSATYTTGVAGQYNVTYSATYNNAGVACRVVRAASIIVPYIPDLKYSISCGSGANYTVKLFNNSNYYPTTIPNSIVYKIKNVATNGTTSYTATQVATGIALPAGNYIASIELTKTTAPAYAMCSKQVPFILGSKPNVAFTKSASSTCPNTPIALALVGAVNPDWKYLWEFGNGGATNTQPNPFFSTTTALPYAIRLTVTDQYGCTFTTLPQTVNVINPTQLTQTASPPSIQRCQGTPAILSFSTLGITPPPVSYQWMRGNIAVVGATTNPYSTGVPGNYWLQTANTSGCFRPVLEYAVSVSFVDIPFPQINTLSQVCIDNGVPLSNIENGSDSFQYIWRRDGVVVNNTPNFTDYPASTGTYTYTLEVKAPLGDGTFCSKISLPKTVTVIESPVITSISYQNIINPITGTCNPFKIKLSATANAIGSFSWSNGMNGATVDETAGGAYEVLFSTISGCTATAQIYVPKDLSSYLWVVPKGCYTFCNKVPTQQVLGPAEIEFPSWAWLQDTVAAPNGTLAVTPKDLNYAGNYQLLLDNNSCIYKSDPFSITYQNCDNNTNCNWFSASVTNVNVVTNPYIYYTMVLNLTNTSNSSYIATITTLNEVGFFVPATITVPPGGGTYSVSLIASNTFGGGYVKMFVTTPDRDGNLCQKIIIVNLPSAGGSSNRGSHQSESNNNLLVFPNPASDNVSIQYNYGSNSIETQLEVYDPTTRLMES